MNKASKIVKDSSWIAVHSGQIGGHIYNRLEFEFLLYFLQEEERY